MRSRILVTVGTQLPFDRLVGAVDSWAGGRSDIDGFAQIGAGAAPRHLTHAVSVDPDDFAGRLAAADLVVAHAGMGTILTALDLGKPVVVMPRRADLGEHRNEHQRATVARLAHLAALHVVEDAASLASTLEGLLAPDAVVGARPAPSPALETLVTSVAAFVAGGLQPC